MQLGVSMIDFLLIWIFSLKKDYTERPNYVQLLVSTVLKSGLWILGMRVHYPIRTGSSNALFFPSCSFFLWPLALGRPPFFSLGQTNTVLVASFTTQATACILSDHNIFYTPRRGRTMARLMPLGLFLWEPNSQDMRLNPLSLSIIIQILLTGLHTFCSVLVRKTYLNINWRPFIFGGQFLNSQDLYNYVLTHWYGEEKLDAGCLNTTIGA